jgi:S-adenosylmethionine synthetase
VKGDFIFTSESVTDGHPDKLCDRISDALVDRYLQQDPLAVVAAECAVATGILFISVRFAADAGVDIPGVARSVIAASGYGGDGFDPKTCSIMTSLGEIPLSERRACDEADLDDAAIERIAAAHQVTVFGFACTQSPGFLPLPIWLAHKLARRLARVRADGSLGYLAPDGKTQVSVEYQDRRPTRIHGLTLTAAVDAGRAPSPRRLRDDLADHVVKPVFEDEDIRPDGRTQLFVNPGGPFLVGGPALHSGLTGRKIGVDTYGEYARQSGSALSGKDPGRIDRIGTYAARHAARTVVVAGLAEECEVQVSYAIGQARPVSLYVETFGTGVVADTEIADRLARHFDFRPAGIVRNLGLRGLPAARPRGFYGPLAAFGHVGRVDLDLPWERTDLADALR